MREWSNLVLPVTLRVRGMASSSRARSRSVPSRKEDGRHPLEKITVELEEPVVFARVLWGEASIVHERFQVAVGRGMDERRPQLWCTKNQCIRLEMFDVAMDGKRVIPGRVIDVLQEAFIEVFLAHREAAVSDGCEADIKFESADFNARAVGTSARTSPADAP